MQWSDLFSILLVAFWPSLWSSGQSSWLHNGDVLCFLWVTNWIYICYVEESRPSLWSSGQNSWLHNGDALYFMWCTYWIYIYYVEESRRPLLSSGLNSCLQIQRCVFDFLRKQIFWELVGQERGLLRFVITIEELLEKKSNCSFLENENTAVGIVTLTTWHPLSSKFGTIFVDKRLLGRYSLLSYSGHGV
jgi:hypothetical protein